MSTTERIDSQRACLEIGNLLFSSPVLLSRVLTDLPHHLQGLGTDGPVLINSQIDRHRSPFDLAIMDIFAQRLGRPLGIRCAPSLSSQPLGGFDAGRKSVTASAFKPLTVIRAAPAALRIFTDLRPPGARSK